jgi:hypothetical protein
MQIIWGSEREPDLNQALHDWACAKIDATRGLMPCTTMGVFHGPKLIAVLVYHNWNPEAGVIEISGAADSSRWLTRSVAWEMHAYPFNELRCQMVVQRNSERNVSANGRGLQRMLAAYGYDAIRVPRLYGRDEAGILHCLTDDVWRANGYHGKPLKVSPPLEDSVAA